MKHVEIVVSGKVQGVYYRASTKQKADALGVKGFVRNQPDGTVYIEAEAPPEVLKEFIEWCWQGPERARVEQVETHDSPMHHFKTFDVLR